MNKHAPGPWRYAAKLTASENHRGYYVSDDRGWALCSVQPADSDGAEGEANARLIAAAPELLEALILMVRTHDEPAESLWQEAREQQWISKARAAIAKATGAQS